ncbi:hypothetical protein PsAD2_00029 [Pseudovibrio axinellae]|uniref:N-acetyltransferase domain-containing protein n=1 Tax=Pseudovibrio axinellae TaxID=989403 RepID=A0A161VCQ0_9HYPH|nr:N-acetyltransferase [Pseudovibrio axinellae]KZL22004.1 hypothetical protein PsAD2_00029 [Pseudovibrio axinellae]SEQ59115.1 putative acetyltransferase [Pseudovibrio axinellae]
MVEFHQIGEQQVSLRVPAKQDEHTIRSLLNRAYGQSNEGRLIKRLRACGAVVLERMATDRNGDLLGYLALSRVTGTGYGHRLKISCLAPVCVCPSTQRKGIGTKLIQSALDDLQGLGEDLVLVLGAPAYFSRFGFDSELAKKVHGPYAGPIFMALPFTQAGRIELPTDVTYATPFEEFE